MNLKFLDKYFEVDKDKLLATGQLIPSDLRHFLEQGGILDPQNRTRKDSLKVQDWLDIDRHKEFKKETFKNHFGIEWKDLPIEFKDLNKSERMVTCSLNDSAWKDERYVNYIRSKWHELRDILIDYYVKYNDDLTFTDKIYGEVNEMPFVYALAYAANCLIDVKDYKSAERSFNQFLNKGRAKEYSVIETFLASAAHRCKNYNDKHKESTLAFYIDLARRVEELYQNKSLKKVA